MLNFRYIIRVSQLCKFPSLGRRQGRQGRGCKLLKLA